VNINIAFHYLMLRSLSTIKKPNFWWLW